MSSFLSQIVEEAGIAEMEQITIPSIILHLYCQATPVTEASKPIRKMIVETLREDRKLREVGTTLSTIKGI